MSAKPAEPVLVTNWYHGSTSPVRVGYYERHFSDGIFAQWWDGEFWLTKEGGIRHWRQVGDYPTWRGRRVWVLIDRSGCYLTGLRPVHTLKRDLADARPFKTERAAERFAASHSSLNLTAVLP